ncbi:hypothetical protein Tco_0749669, partial [Tanacetum coccineum]
MPSDIQHSAATQIWGCYKDTLPQLLKDSIKISVSQSIAEELPHVEAQVQKNLQDQIPNLLLKPMYKEFNAFNKLESQRFGLLHKQFSKSLHKNMRKSIRLKVRKGMKEVRDKLSSCTSTVATNSQHVQDLRVMFKDMVFLLEAAEVFKKANAEGEKANTANIILGEEPSAQAVPNKEKALVVHNLEEKKSKGTILIDDDSDDDLDKQSLSKRFKIMTPIPNPIPLNTFAPEHLLKPEEQQKSLHDFTNQLFGTTSSKFLPTPPREPTPPRDPAKGKEVAIVKEQVNELVTYQEEGGSIPKMPKLKSFITLEGTLSQEEFNNQIKELKRIRLPPPLALTTFRMTVEEKKSKRTQFLKEAFVTEDIRVDGMNRNPIPPPRVLPIEGLVINEPESGIFFMNMNTDIAFQRESEFHLTPTIQLIRIQN